MTQALTLPAFLSPEASWWYHEDPAGISEAASRGTIRAANADWTSGTPQERVRDFRGALVARAWVMARLGGTAGMTGGGGEAPGPLVVQVDDRAFDATETSDSFNSPEDKERARAVRVLGATPLCLARHAGSGFEGWTPPRLTVTGRPETGFPPLIVVAIIAVSGAAALAAIAYCSNQAAQVVDNWLARDQAAKELMQADAQALAVLDRHVARETAAGAALPLDEPTKILLDSLVERQKIVAAKTTAPVKSQIPGLPDWGVPAIAAVAIGAALFLAK